MHASTSWPFWRERRFPYIDIPLLPVCVNRPGNGRSSQNLENVYVRNARYRFQDIVWKIRHRCDIKWKQKVRSGMYVPKLISECCHVCQSRTRSCAGAVGILHKSLWSSHLALCIDVQCDSFGVGLLVLSITRLLQLRSASTLVSAAACRFFVKLT